VRANSEDKKTTYCFSSRFPLFKPLVLYKLFYSLLKGTRNFPQSQDAKHIIAETPCKIKSMWCIGPYWSDFVGLQCLAGDVIGLDGK
jgi:hypothetical protein